MSNKRSLLLAFSFLCICFALCMAENKTRITFVQTSDLHGVVLGYDYFTGQQTATGLSRISTLVNRIRKENKNTIVLDGGDTIQGNPLMYVAAKKYPELANPIISGMNRIGYAVMTVGNHEFNFGFDYLMKSQEEADFPFISANIRRKSSGEHVFDPFKVIQVDDIKIGILGLTTPAIPEWELPEHIVDLEFLDLVETARKWVTHLREEIQCDLVVVLMHSGFEKLVESDYSKGLPGENAAFEIAQSVSGIDVMFTGHTHSALVPQIVGQTFASSAPPNSKGVVRVDLEIEKLPNGKLLIDKSGEIIEMNDSFEVDNRITDAALELHTLTEQYLETVIATTDEKLYAPPDRLNDTKMMDILQLAQLKATGADVSIASLLPWQGVSFPAGDVKVRHMFQFYQYENEMLVVELTGAQIKQFLETSALYYEGASLDSTGKLAVTVNKRISLYNVDFMEGVRYRIDPTAKAGSKIKDLSYKGKTIDPNMVFTVAVNSYRYAGGGGFEVFENAKVIKRLKNNVRELLIEFLKQHDPDSIVCSHNWSIAPDLVVGAQ